MPPEVVEFGEEFLELLFDLFGHLMSFSPPLQRAFPKLRHPRGSGDPE